MVDPGLCELTQYVGQPFMDRQGRVGALGILIALTLVSFLSVFWFVCFLTWPSRLAVM